MSRCTGLGSAAVRGGLTKPDKSITKDGYQQHFEDEDEHEDVLFEFIVGAKKPGIL